MLTLFYSSFELTIFFFLELLSLDRYMFGYGGDTRGWKDTIKTLKVTYASLQVMAILCVFTSFVLRKKQQSIYSLFLILFLHFETYMYIETHILSLSPIAEEEMDAARRYCTNFRDMTLEHESFLRSLLYEMFPKARVDAYFIVMKREPGGKYFQKKIFFPKK